MKDIKPMDSNTKSVEGYKKYARTAVYMRTGETSNEPESLSGSSTASSSRRTPKHETTLICFGAIPAFKKRVKLPKRDPEWGVITHNPFILIIKFFDAWYERVNRIVWSANHYASYLEQVSFVIP